MHQVKKVYRKKISEKESRDIGTFLSEETKISKQKIKHALNCGAVWRQKEGKGKLLRVRRVSSELCFNDVIEMYYDEDILSREMEAPEVIFDSKYWGVWFKPAGMLSQGNKFGDHLSLLRHVEKNKEEAFLVHRIDREVSGLMLVAYSKKMAAYFSSLWQKNEVKKTYLAVVAGDISTKFKSEDKIDDSLEGKSAITYFKILRSSEKESLLEVQIETGRYHQIRRHFEIVGFPVLGDPAYGTGNKNNDGLQLFSYKLSFLSPKNDQMKEITLPEKYLPNALFSR